MGNALIDRKGKKYVLLRGVKGNVFWTTNNEEDSLDNYELLYAGNTKKEMVAQWEKYYKLIF